VSLETSKKYWDEFYRQFNLSDQSSFAELIIDRVPPLNLILDLGCGNGRDTFYFARATKADILALDSSDVAIDTVRRAAKIADMSNRISTHKFDFETQSLSDLEGVALGNSLTEHTVVLYARFLIHALTEAGEDGFWALVEDVLATSFGTVYLALEYRTPKDAELPKQTPTHFRRYVEPSRTHDRAEQLGFSALINEQGSGFSIFGADDAHLCRQLFRWDRREG
jgi:tellurite methyltransferase